MLSRAVDVIRAKLGIPFLSRSLIILQTKATD